MKAKLLHNTNCYCKDCLENPERELVNTRHQLDHLINRMLNDCNSETNMYYIKSLIPSGAYLTQETIDLYNQKLEESKKPTGYDLGPNVELGRFDG